MGTYLYNFYTNDVYRYELSMVVTVIYIDYRGCVYGIKRDAEV